MNEEWEPADYVVRALSTRPVRISGEQHLTRFTRGALEDIVQQVRRGFLPMTVEHLDYIPPIARWFDGEVREAEDGEWELMLHGRELSRYQPEGDDPRPLELVDRLPESSVDDIEVSLGLEPRNYPRGEWAQLAREAPFPVKEDTKWADLPPLIYAVSVLVTWGAIKFAGPFLEQLGRNTADALTAWLRKAKGKALNSDRTALVEFNFELPNGSRIMAFIPMDESSGNVQQLADALSTVGEVASFAGLQSANEVLPRMRQAAYIYDDGAWMLAWWTDGDDLFITNWYRQNAPDASIFLGRPLLGVPENLDTDVE
jgi:hypothetical protein